MTLTTAIEAAERAGREALASLADDMQAIAERAKAVRADTNRLTDLKDEGARVETVIRNAAEHLRSEPREPTGEGENVDAEHMQRVREARDVLPMQTRGTG